MSEENKPKFDLAAALRRKKESSENRVSMVIGGGITTGKSEGGIDVPEAPPLLGTDDQPIAKREVADGKKPELAVDDDLVPETAYDFGILVIGHIARICHEANRELCKCIGDNSLMNWDSAPMWQKESVIQGVKAHLKEQLSPMDSHASWMRKKHEDGWKYGIVKDAEAKTHPCLVPYSELPPEHQAKDFLFASIIRALQLFYKEG